MRKIKSNRLLAIGGIALAAIILISLLVGIGIHNKDVSRQNSENQKSKVKYVLVNEDNGAKFNNKNYNLGRDFLKLVSQDQKHDWETASYDGAQDGMKNGLYDVEVIIPRDFSKRILSLESTSPKKAGITYHVRKGQNEVTNQIIGRNVDQLIYDFNNRVVRMYFSSLIGNLRNAQLAMGNIANKQDLQVSDLANQVQQPFNGLDDQFGALFNTASILDENGIADSQDFSNNMRNFLDGINKQSTANDAINSQSIKDLQDKLNGQLDTYDELNQKSNNYQNELKKYFGPENPLEKLKQKNISNQRHPSADNSFAGDITNLDVQYDSLLKEKNNLESEYGLKPGKTDENVTNIINHLLNSTNDPNSDPLQTAINNINSNIADLAIVDDITLPEYKTVREILIKYSNTVGADFGNRHTSFVKQKTGDTHADVTLGLKPGENDIVFNGDGISVKAEVEKIEAEGFEVTETSTFTDNHMKIVLKPKETTTKEDKADSKTKDDKKESEKEEQSDNKDHETAGETTSTQGNAFVTLKVTYQYDKPSQYSWSVNGDEQNSGDIQQLSTEDPNQLANYIAKSTAAAQQVVDIYGNEKDMSISTFAKDQPGNKLVPLKGSLADTASQTPSQPTTPDDKEIKQQAETLADQYDKVCQQLETLGQASGNLPVTDDTNSDIKALNEISKNLGKDGLQAYLNNVSNAIDWYNKVQELVNQKESGETAKDTGENSKVDVPTSIEATPDGDQQSNNDLTKQYNDLQKAINDSTTALDDKGKNSKDLKPVIKDLTNNTTKLQNSTNSIKDKLSQNVKDSQNQANNNQDFAQAFNNVMKNTRNGEADNSKVYNFLTNPIKATGSYSELRQQSIIPYFMTLIGTIAALFVGLGIAKHLLGRKVTADTALVEHTKPWLNLPSTGITLGISLVVGLFFSLITLNVVPGSVRIDWIIYTTLIMVILTSAISAGARHHRMITLYVVGFILALYILLTPFIGVLVRSGSFIQFLYRISPLQNVETGYTVMINHGTIGFFTFFGLIIALIIVIVANLFIKPLPIIEEDNISGDQHEA